MTTLPFEDRPLDVCVVATRRPRLLEQTLRSFHANLFSRFSEVRYVVNIDPLFGDASDQAECEAIVRGYDAQARIRTPQEANFTRAVASNWLASTASLVFHLEDDWLLTRPVHPAQTLMFDEFPWLGQISFNHANKRWNAMEKGCFCYAERGVKLLGRTFMHRRKQNFLTGPSFWRGSFARSSAALMNPAFDPEKQFCRGLNARLEQHVASFRNLILGEPGSYYIEDIGRSWRAERRIRKDIRNGQSYWTQPAV